MCSLVCRILDSEDLTSAQQLRQSIEPRLHGSEGFRYRRKHFRAARTAEDGDGEDGPGLLDREEILRRLDIMQPASRTLGKVNVGSGSEPAGLPTGPGGRQPDPNMAAEGRAGGGDYPSGVVAKDAPHPGSFLHPFRRR